MSRKENVAPEALAAAVNLWALDALRLTVASAANRRALTEAGLLPALARILKAALSRLHSLAAVLGAPYPSPQALRSQPIMSVDIHSEAALCKLGGLLSASCELRSVV